MARFDADDICLPERLARQVEFLDARPEVGVVGSRIRVIDAAGQLLGYRVLSLPARSDRRGAATVQCAVAPQRDVPQAAGCGLAGISTGGTRPKTTNCGARLAHAGVRFANLASRCSRYRGMPGPEVAKDAGRRSAGTIDVKRLALGRAVELARPGPPLGRARLAVAAGPASAQAVSVVDVPPGRSLNAAISCGIGSAGRVASAAA